MHSGKLLRLRSGELAKLNRVSASPASSPTELEPLSFDRLESTDSGFPADPIPSPQEESTYEAVSARYIRLNIGGTSFVFKKDALVKRPATRLSRLVQATAIEDDSERFNLIGDLIDDYFEATEEFYFDRSPCLFEPIATYYRTGLLHKPDQYCNVIFRSELKYWGIDPVYLMNCCDAARLLKHLTEAYKSKTKKPRRDSKGKELDFDATSQYRFWADFRHELWSGLEQPWKSKLSLAYAIVSLIFIILSVTIMIVESMPNLAFETCKSIPELAKYYNDTNNETIALSVLHVVRAGKHGAKRDQVIEDLLNYCPSAQITLAFQIVGLLCMAIFTIDYALRIFSAPRIFRFIFSPLGLADLLSIIPFYVDLIFSTPGLLGTPTLASIYHGHSGVIISFRAIRFLRFFRVIMVFKLARFSTGIKLMALVMRYSYSALVLILLYGAMYILVFGTVLYFLEGDLDGTKFYSIPAGCWWAVVTLTTLGYGDMVPETWYGKCVAAIATIISVLILAFPVSIIVDNMKKAFAQLDSERERKVKSLKKTKNDQSNWQSIRQLATLRAWRTGSLLDLSPSLSPQARFRRGSSMPSVFASSSQESTPTREVPESSFADEMTSGVPNSSLEVLSSEIKHCDPDTDQVTFTVKLSEIPRKWRDMALKEQEGRQEGLQDGAMTKALLSKKKNSLPTQLLGRRDPEGLRSQSNRKLSDTGARRNAAWSSPTFARFNLGVVQEENEPASSREADQEPSVKFATGNGNNGKGEVFAVQRL